MQLRCVIHVTLNLMKTKLPTIIEAILLGKVWNSTILLSSVCQLQSIIFNETTEDHPEILILY